VRGGNPLAADKLKYYCSALATTFTITVHISGELIEGE